MAYYGLYLAFLLKGESNPHVFGPIHGFVLKDKMADYLKIST